MIGLRREVFFFGAVRRFGAAFFATFRAFFIRLS